MKPIDKKDQPKLFALIGMAVLAFGFGAYQFATSSTAQPTAPAPSPTPDATKVTQGDPGAEGDGNVWTPGGQLDVIPISGRDPFMPEGLAAPQPAATPTPAPKVVANTGGPGIKFPLPPMGSGEGGGFKLPPPIPNNNGAGGMEVGPIKVIQATPTPPPPAPTLNLSGVIVAEDNDRSKAIFKTADNKTSRILSIGDSAGNGWRIADIQEGKVEIIDPKTGRRATVELE